MPLSSLSLIRAPWGAWLCGLALVTLAARPAQAQAQAPAPPEAPPRWGAIASFGGWHGYAFNHATRAAAEQDARTRCDRVARRPGACLVRNTFSHACGALALGNYGEWGTATAPTAEAAAQAATRQCDSHLPTEPCKVVLRVCSPP